MAGPKYRKKGVSPFLLVPIALLNCPKYRALSSSAIKLMYDIASQYNGKNNGDLCAAWKVMRPKGWKSEATLNKAKKELVAAGFIAVTRIGHLPNTCSLYGITWQPLNPSPKFDYGPNGFPAGEWQKLPPPNVAKNNAHTNTETVVDQPSIATEIEAEELA